MSFFDDVGKKNVNTPVLQLTLLDGKRVYSVNEQTTLVSRCAVYKFVFSVQLKEERQLLLQWHLGLKILKKLFFISQEILKAQQSCFPN